MNETLVPLSAWTSGSGSIANRKVRRALFAALAIGVGSLLGFGLAEGLLRWSNMWIGRHSDTMFDVMEQDRELGWRMKRRFRGTVDLVDVEDLPVRSNSDGFWDNEFETYKRQEVCRVAFLGDSFTWGFGVRETERFSNLLGLTGGIQPMNFGIPGFGADQAYLTWRFARRFRPDLVVFTLFENDYIDNLHVVRYGREKPYFVLDNGALEIRNVPVGARTFWDDGVFNEVAPPYAHLFPEPVQRRSRIAHWLAKKSDVARFVYTLSRTAPSSAPSSPHPVRMDAPPSVLDGSGDGALSRAAIEQVAVLNAIVGLLATEVRQEQAEFLVILAGHSIDKVDVQKRELARVGIPYLDATTVPLAKSLPGGSADAYLPYSRHWTPASHQVVAALLTDYIDQVDCPARQDLW